MSSSLDPIRHRRWLAGTTLTAIAAIATALFSIATFAAEPARPAATAAVPVSVATVVAADVATWDEFSGRLEAVERVEVRPRVAGAVQSIHFREGALVKRGELLVTIDPAPFQAEVRRAEAQVASAQARVSYTHGEADRAKRLLEEKAIAQRENDERGNAQLEADATLAGAQAGLQSARLSLGYTQVRAPVAGRVGRIEVTVGNLVAAGPGSPLLTTIVSVSPIYASFEADETVVTRAIGQLPGAGAARPLDRIPVQMGTGADDGTPHAGHLQFVDNQVEARSGTVRVRAVFDNADGKLIPGQFARIRMGQAKTSPALLINERAVGTDQNKKFVMVVGADNHANYREVTLGAAVDGLRIVTSGLKAQERIVVNGLQRVRPGALVDPKPVPMDARPEVQARREAPGTS